MDALTAAGIIAEIGADMAVFGTARRLAAWAGVRPANHEGAGKQQPRRTGKGDTHLKATPMTAAPPSPPAGPGAPAPAATRATSSTG